MQKESLASSLLSFKGAVMTAVQPREEVMVIGGVQLQKTMTRIQIMDSAQKQVWNENYLISVSLYSRAISLLVAILCKTLFFYKTGELGISKINLISICTQFYTMFNSFTIAPSTLMFWVERGTTRAENTSYLWASVGALGPSSTVCNAIWEQKVRVSWHCG